MEGSGRTGFIWALLAAVGCANAKGGDGGSGGAIVAAGGESAQSAGSGVGGKVTGRGGADANGGAGGKKPGSDVPQSGAAGGWGVTTSTGGATAAGGLANAGGGVTATASAGGSSGGAPSLGGMTSSTQTGGTAGDAYTLAISTDGMWIDGNWKEAPDATADVTVNEAAVQQTWEGFGGAFHERGWNLLSTEALKVQALNLLFGAEGARFTLARIPIGASDYAIDRYTLDDTGPDVVPKDDESNRPAPDPTLSHFSIERDKQTLIPFIKGAQAMNPKIRFWAVPWTPPVWMKAGYKKESSADTRDLANRPSYYDGGSIKTDAATLQSYAQYLLKFIQAYQGQGISIDSLALQNEPTLAHNYPSCVWDVATYKKYVTDYLGPALAVASLGTKVMVGMLTSEPGDYDLMNAVMSDTVTKSFVKTIGVQWGVLAKVEAVPLAFGVPVWVTEQKCGNYPFITEPRQDSGSSLPLPAYVEPPPNDQAYGVETWWYIRDSITKAKVTAYTFPHMVLDAMGKGNDTTRQWAQNSLLVFDGTKLLPTQAYYVARHFSQFVEPGAAVLGTVGGDAVAFRNPDGELVTVVFSDKAKSDYTVAIGKKRLQFAVPAGGWATARLRQ